MRTVLILAYYFPPMGLGGVQRVQKFVKYLPQYGWRPVVVTVRDVRYHGRDETLLHELPPETTVCRTGSLDPLRLAYRFGGLRTAGTQTGGMGQTFARWILFPDNQVGWIPFAVANALHLMRTERVDAILSTFPPASGHLAGYLLSAMTGTPWVADFRDSWIGGEFDQTPSALHAAMMQSLQRTIVGRATHLTAVTHEIAAQLTEVRGASDVTVLTNGYDPEDFAGLERTERNERLVLTYCGTLNAARNPEPLFRALRHLFDRRPDLPARIEVRLAGASVGLDLDEMIRYYHLENVVTHLGYLAHREALEQLIASDALLLFITSDEMRVRGVPTGKMYEYLAAGRPILGIAPDVSTRDLLHTHDRGTTIPPRDTEGIARMIETWMQQHESGTLPIYPTDDAAVRVFSRPQLTERLARILDNVATA